MRLNKQNHTCNNCGVKFSDKFQKRCYNCNSSLNINYFNWKLSFMILIYSFFLITISFKLITSLINFIHLFSY